jgi:hypothetical protein
MPCLRSGETVSQLSFIPTMKPTCQAPSTLFCCWSFVIVYPTSASTLHRIIKLSETQSCQCSQQYRSRRPQTSYPLHVQYGWKLPGKDIYIVFGQSWFPNKLERTHRHYSLVHALVTGVLHLTPRFRPYSEMSPLERRFLHMANPSRVVEVQQSCI